MIKNKHIFNQLEKTFAEQISTLIEYIKIIKRGCDTIVDCGDLDLQSHLFNYFRYYLGKEKIYLQTVEISNNKLNLFEHLSGLIKRPYFNDSISSDKHDRIVIFVHGLEKLSHAERRQFFYFLNQNRERIMRFEPPFVIWLQPIHVSQMSSSADIFWRAKNYLITFPSHLYLEKLGNRESDNMIMPVDKYLNAILNDSNYTIWHELYLPLRAIRVADTIQTSMRHALTDDELMQLSYVFPKTKTFQADEIIIRKGEHTQETFVLLTGEVHVIMPNALGNEVVISSLRRGDFFGEIALVKNVPRTATIRAVSDCECVVLTKSQLRTMATQIPKIVELLGDIAQQRFEALGKVPSEVMSPLRWFAKQGALIQPVPTDLFELIQHDKRTVILGEVGAGKTTALRRLTLDFTKMAYKQLIENKLPHLPIYIDLHNLTHDGIEHLIQNILYHYGLMTPPQPITSDGEGYTKVEQLLHGQKQDEFPIAGFIFLVDGLDVVKDDETHQQHLQQFVHAYTKHRFVMSCRVQDYVPIRDFKTALIQHLTGYDIECFLINYMGEEQGKKTVREIASDNQLFDLARTPLILYMFSQIAQQESDSPLKNRGLFFEQFTNNLLEQVITGASNLGLTDKASLIAPHVPLQLCKHALAKLALRMHENEMTTYPEEERLNLFEEVITTYQKNNPNLHITADDVLATTKSSGIIHYHGEDDSLCVEFSHYTYQEFFAALALQYQNKPIESYISTYENLRLWYRVIVFLYGISKKQLELFENILGQDSDYARIRLAAQCLANSGQEIAVVAKALENYLHGQHFGILFAVGLASYQLKHYPESLSYFLQATKSRPDNAEVQYELGSLYRQLTQYNKSIEHLTQAIHLRPDFVDAYNQLGITYFEYNKYEESVTVFRATVQLEPNNSYHYYNLGMVQKILHDYESARATFQRAIELKPDWNEARSQFDLVDKAFSSGVINVLKSIPLLSKLSLEQSIQLAGRLKVQEYDAGEIVFHMGQKGSSFYIIEHGNIQVVAPDIEYQTGKTLSFQNQASSPHEKETIVINHLKEGDFFGEIALLRDIPRTATIRCASAARLLKLDRVDFDNIAQYSPFIAHALTETSSHRLRQDKERGRRTAINNYYDFGYLQEILEKQNIVTVLMGDMHGSSFITDAVGPEIMASFLDEYLLRMSTIAVNAGGVMDKSLGDSVMAVFGKFEGQKSETKASAGMRALFAAMQMRQAYLELRQEWRSKSHQFMQTGMGIGISTDEVKISTVGAEGAMVGSAVNMGSKLSKMKIRGRDESEVYIDGPTYEMIGEAIKVQQLKKQYVLSQSGGVDLDVYLVLDTPK